MKTEYENHSHVIFDGLDACAVVHDPDCACFNKK